MNDDNVADHGGVPVLSPSLSWPPPGLERLQGDLWRIAARAGLGAGLLVLPLLFVVARGRDFSTLGPFHDAWWVTLILATAGLAFAIDAVAGTGRALRRSARALEQGYDWRTVGFVLADLRRDMGFLLQGGRHFSAMPPEHRGTVAVLRVVSVGCHAAAGLWMTLALGVGLILAARGLVSPRELWIANLAPAFLLYLVGGITGAAEDSRVRAARRGWHRQPWASDLVSLEIASWRTHLGRIEGRAEPRAANASAAPTLRRLSVLVGALAVLVCIPVLTLVPASAIGPVLAAVSMPNFTSTLRRAAESEGYRSYALQVDETLDPQMAGELLQELLWVGSTRQPVGGERAPRRRFTEPWFESIDGDNPTGMEFFRWAEGLFPVVAGGDVTPELRTFLAGIAAHPAHASYSRLATAASIDVVSARYLDPLPVDVGLAMVPIPRFSQFREGASARVAAAAHELLEGRPERAETMLRETVSVGLLMGDHDPTLIGNLVGYVVAKTGATALESFYASTGRVAEAEALGQSVDVAKRTAARSTRRVQQGVEAHTRSLPGFVTDTTVMRGLRWEYFNLTTTVAPCLNLRRIVFGPDAAYEAFLDSAHSALVRWPSEEKLFELARFGYWSDPSLGGRGFLGKVLGVSMWPGAGGCGDAVQRWRLLGEMM